MTKSFIITFIETLREREQSFVINTNIPYGRSINGVDWKSYYSQGKVGNYTHQLVSIVFYEGEMTIGYTTKFTENPNAPVHYHLAALSYDSIISIETGCEKQETPYQLG